MPAGTYRITIGPFFYIGSSSDLQRRKHAHKYLLRKGQHQNAKLQAAYNQHGTYEFTITERIFIRGKQTEREFMDRLKDEEQKLIDEHAGDINLCNKSLNSRAPDKWCDHVNALRKAWQDPEFRARMTAKAASRAPVSEESRRKMAAAKMGDNNHQSRPVIVTHPDGRTERFPSAREASKFFRVTQQCMDQWLKGITAWPGTGRITREKNRWIIPYRAAFEDMPSNPRTLHTVG